MKKIKYRTKMRRRIINNSNYHSFVYLALAEAKLFGEWKSIGEMLFTGHGRCKGSQIVNLNTGL